MRSTSGVTPWRPDVPCDPDAQAAQSVVRTTLPLQLVLPLQQRVTTIVQSLPLAKSLRSRTLRQMPRQLRLVMTQLSAKPLAATQLQLILPQPARPLSTQPKAKVH